MNVSNESLRTFARAEIADAMDNLSDLMSRFEYHNEMLSLLSKVNTLLDIADDILIQIKFKDE